MAVRWRRQVGRAVGYHAFLTKGGNAVVPKNIIRHEGVQTTEKYVHFQPEDLQKQHWKY